jgi:thiol-disulfide isomerase/thioredoxin
MTHYDSTIVATVSEGGTQLDGTWSKVRSATETTKMAFHAVAGQELRFGPPEKPVTFADSGPMVGRWRVQFSSSDTHAIGVFKTPKPGNLLGTFLTTTGDYGQLEGQIDGKRLRLSRFDGAHAFLFDAKMTPEGRLEGDFWSRDTWHETWTAERDENVILDHAFGLSSVNAEVDLAGVSFPDLAGQRVSLNDARFAGKPRIIELFGSWCPNCHDAAAYLVELEKRYKHRGLQIVGVAFELTGDFARDARQVRRYAEKYGIQYPLLIAGVADKAKASAAFPLLDRVVAYPTFLFVGTDNQVRAAYTGFSGPATGEAYEHLQRSFERALEGILPQADSPEPEE